MKNLQEINGRMVEMEDILNQREFTAEETSKYNALKREFEAAQRENAVEQDVARQRELQPKKNAGEVLRELLKGQRDGSVEREVTLGTQGASSGAINLTVKDLVPNLEEGTGLPSGLSIVTGVTGNVVFPTDASDMEIEEAGEVATLNDQVVNFDNVTVTPKRCTLSCDISNSMIDNAAFDIIGHVNKKFNKSLRVYLAKKLYSQAAFSGNKGGFSGLTAAGSITLGSNAAKAILEAVAEFTDKGFDADGVCLVIDAPTEAKLKMEPLIKGEGLGTVIQNGKLLGYEYVVSHHINTVLGGDSKTGSGNTDATKLYKTTANYLGIGYFEYIKVQQHGHVRMSMDGTSKAMAKKNCVNICLNTEFSFTDLSNHIYDENGAAVKAFAVYTIA